MLVVTVLYAVCALALRFVLGESVPAHAVFSSLPAAVLWNLILTLPVYGVVRRLFPPVDHSDRAFDVHLLSSSG